VPHEQTDRVEHAYKVLALAEQALRVAAEQALRTETERADAQAKRAEAQAKRADAEAERADAAEWRERELYRRVCQLEARLESKGIPPPCRCGAHTTEEWCTVCGRRLNARGEWEDEEEG
jgi:hypothetical protein